MKFVCLTPLDIPRSQLLNAEFALLSCCHAAEITEEMIADNALHLTTTMQYCNPKRAMAETDRRDLKASTNHCSLAEEQVWCTMSDLPVRCSTPQIS